MATITQPTHSSTTMTSRGFNQDTGRAKATADGPVFVIDRGVPTHVLLSIDQYLRLQNAGKNIIELLAMPELDDFADLDIDTFDREFAKIDNLLISEERIEALVKDLTEAAV